jgi:hypothetical protein
MVHKSKLAFIAAPSPRRQSLPAHVCGIIQMLPREFGSIMHPAVSRCRYSSGEAAVPLRAQASDEVIEKDTVCCSARVRNRRKTELQQTGRANDKVSRRS